MNRDFALLFSARSLSLYGDGITLVAIAFGVLQLTGSPTDVGLVLGARTLPLVAFMLVGGAVADRVPRRRLMVISDSVNAAAAALLALAFVRGSVAVWQLCALQAVAGFASAFFYPALNGSIPETTSGAQLQRANAMLRLSRSVATLLGSGTGGILVAAAGAGSALAVDAATFAASALLLSFVRLTRSGSRARIGHLGIDIADGWRELRRRKWIWVIVAHFSFISFAVWAPFQVLGPVVAKQSLGGAAAWGWIVSAGAAGSAVGGLAALRLRPVRPMLTAYRLLWIEALPLAALAWRAPFAIVAITSAVAGAQLAFSGIMWDTALQEHIAPGLRSRISAWDWLGTFALLPVGLAGAGALSTIIGVTAVLWLGAACMVLSTAAVVCVAEVRNLRRTLPPWASPSARPTPVTPSAASTG